MPLKETIYAAIRSERRDQARQAPSVETVRQLVGFDVGPQAAGMSKLVSAPGADLITTRQLHRAPIHGATGETDATFNANSAPGSMTLVMLTIEGLEGNIFAWVANGNGAVAHGPGAGNQGAVRSVYQETWGDKKRIDLGIPQYIDPPPEPEPCVLPAPVLISPVETVVVFPSYGGDTLLEWEAVEGATAYDVYTSQDTPGPWVPLETDITDTFAMLTNLVVDVTVYWRVVAKAPDCESSESQTFFTTAEEGGGD